MILKQKTQISLSQKSNFYKVIVSNKVSFGKKDFNFFIGYKDNEKGKSLCIMLPKMSE